MLTSQIFNPRPLIAVGPELFWSDGPGHVDLNTLRVFRNTVQSVPFFDFVFIALKPSPKHGDTAAYAALLSEFSIKFRSVYVLPGATKPEKMFLDSLLLLADLVYSPEVLDAARSEMLVRSRNQWHGPPLAVVQVLAQITYHETEPYTPELLLRRLNEWTSRHA